MTIERLGATTAAGLAISLGLTTAAVSQSQVPDIPDGLADGFHRNVHIEQYVAEMVSRLRQADRANDGLDQGDIDFTARRRAAQARAGAIHQVLPMDLDGDLRITRAEIGSSTSDEADDQTTRDRRIDHHLLRYDTDGDGVITLQEAAATAPYQRFDGRLNALLALDPNGDGRLTAEELGPLAEQAFRRVDSNGDGQATDQEIAPLMPRIRENQMIWTAEICTLPPVPSNAKLIVVGSYRSDLTATAQIPGKAKRTHLAEATIEPGSQPLYLVLTSYESMQWQLSGAVNRVTNVVAASLVQGRGSISAARVAGIASGKVTIARAGCPNYFYQAGSDEAKRTQASIRASLKRDPDAMFGNYTIGKISLPSGLIAPVETD
jgi:hypothetical protein